MTDMTAFERRVADAMVRRAGPVRPVDDLAVFESVIAANRQQGWGFTMLSALKFVAAAAIVALFGGFLLAGVLTTQQGDDMTPGAVTAPAVRPRASRPGRSPSVRTDLLPGVTLRRGGRDGHIPHPRRRRA